MISTPVERFNLHENTLEQYILDTNAGEQLFWASTDV